ncbi:GNAT family N-acetyltransferase [Actinosynnema sp. NPDC047251]|uniref:Acetyltransferase-like protein n=1 Tax=Saccharothrix espanaensis (strain ATCC 51144 / DSM 44229 / JCM 9112 / NBRC 15066 / NRRL 15764) TaxID=1179773 RepID=K0KBW6_SACES|nr:GNAT family N-acetyltransferase [Saccharothrix espanaensis]CCH35686.1 Acetyltransferase-like protein [Saccharothrix espanaensis DSM 44229]
MRSNDWHSTEDVEDFHSRAGGFLRSRPARHTMALTAIEKLRAEGAGGTAFGRLERGGEVRATYFLRPTGRLSVTALAPEQADTLAAHLAELGRPLAGVTAEEDTATAFTEAWQRHTGATHVPTLRVRLYRLGTLTPPEPVPSGRGRVADGSDREQVIRWCADFCAAVGEDPSPDAAAWAASRFGDKHYTFWEDPDGTPVSFAGWTSMVAGMVRVDPVHTPAHLRGRGYGAAVTVEVGRAALDAGATDVVLFADPANATSNALYQRLGYVRVTDVIGCDVSPGAAR